MEEAEEANEQLELMKQRILRNSIKLNTWEKTVEKKRLELEEKRLE